MHMGPQHQSECFTKVHEFRVDMVMKTPRLLDDSIVESRDFRLLIIDKTKQVNWIPYRFTQTHRCTFICACLCVCVRNFLFGFIYNNIYSIYIYLFVLCIYIYRGKDPVALRWCLQIGSRQVSSQEVGRGKDQEQEVREEDSNVQSVKRFNRSKVGSLPSREIVGHRHPEVDIVGYTYTQIYIHIYICL